MVVHAYNPSTGLRQEDRHKFEARATSISHLFPQFPGWDLVPQKWASTPWQKCPHSQNLWSVELQGCLPKDHTLFLVPLIQPPIESRCHQTRGQSTLPHEIVLIFPAKLVRDF